VKQSIIKAKASATLILKMMKSRRELNTIAPFVIIVLFYFIFDKKSEIFLFIHILD
jgi:hypothetical protein